MKKRRVLFVGVNIPAQGVERIDLDSDQSLMDADIVVFEPGFPEEWVGATVFEGRPTLTEYASAHVLAQFERWRKELALCVDAGRTAIVMLASPQIVNRHAGTTYSGTGRNTRRTNLLERVDGYSAIPVKLASLTERSGTRIAEVGDLGAVSGYWRRFKDRSKYRLTFTSNEVSTLLSLGVGGEAVGGIVKGKKGALVLLPPVDLSGAEYIRRTTDEEYWTPAAEKVGDEFIAEVLAMDAALRSGAGTTETPEWALNEILSSPTERRARESMAEAEQKIEELRGSIAEQSAIVLREQKLLGLLYETGKPLERAVRRALRAMGFKAHGLVEDDLEFDAVFEASEGRFIGETEGKDTKAINIDKLSQLIRVLNEDLARDEVSERANGVLFGNADRLSPVAERGEFFTEKCRKTATRERVALVRTPDMLAPARYLEETKDDEYAAACRGALVAGAGGVVVFPKVPT